MSLHSSSNNENGNEGTGLVQGINWIACGRRLVLEQKSLWYGMTGIYLVLGFLLKLIPIGGNLLLILFTPMLLASVVWGRAQEQHAETAAKPDASSPALAQFQSWIAQPAQELFRIFSHEEKIYSAVLLGIVTLGLTILVMIPREWFVGGSMVSGLAASDFGVQFLMVLKILFVAVLYVILAMGLLFSVPLTVLGNRQPLAAISESFSTCRENAVALLALTVPFFLVYLVILLAHAKSHLLGYLLLISVGFLALPVFVAAVYCSYLTLYPTNASDIRQ